MGQEGSSQFLSALWLLKFWFYLFFFKLQPIRTGNSAWILIPFWFFFELSGCAGGDRSRVCIASLFTGIPHVSKAEKKPLGRLFLGWNCAISDLTLRGVPGNVKKKPKFPFPWKEIYFGVAAFNVPDVQSCWGRILGQNFEEFDLFPSLSHWNFPGFFPPKEHPKTKTAKSPRRLYFYCIF